MRRTIVSIVAALAAMSQAQTVVPSPRHLAWHKLETYAFVHFGPNTFSGKEWGDGREPAASFNPTELDCKQWVKAFKAAGMKAVILTAKHHDGFCLWPSKFSTHTVSATPHKTDVLKELSKACKAEGLKLGVYLSPWDRNHPTYGTDAYNDTFVNMLTEVLSNYGDIFEVWFDGANGEGPNGKRQIYDWNRYIATVRKLQPNAVIFSDAGPDVRWVGNEQGISPTTNWHQIDRDRYTPGTDKYKELGEGKKGGTHWVPSECDVSIRPGWFWRASENGKVKSPAELVELYFASVGRGSSFLLNVPPDTRGKIHETDVANLAEYRKRIDAIFAKNLVSTSRTVKNETVIELKPKSMVDVLRFAEPIKSGQKVGSFKVYSETGGKRELVATGTTIGNKRLIRLAPFEASRIVIKTDQPVALTNLGAFLSPASLRTFAHETKEQKDARMAWWRDSRFGMFIHWGLYSIPGGTWQGKIYPGAAEWLINTAKINIPDWEPLQSQFNPVNFDAKKIVGAAKAAGMKYIVITSKHHEGFAMYPSKIGTWNIGHTPFKRDPLKELSEECKRQGIKFCTYHSILDWHHPDYLPKTSYDKRDRSGANFDEYVKVLKAQLREVVENYHPAVMWFDGEWENTWTHERGKDLYDYVRRLDPSIIINNRVDTGRQGMNGFSASEFRGDFGTPEQEIPANGVATDWESCMTMNGSWGYHENDHDWKSVDTLIFNLVDCASKGGNYLLNVGPTGLGEIPPASVARLNSVGQWLKQNGEGVYKTQASPFPKPLSWGRVTRKGNVLYCTVFDRKTTVIDLPGLRNDVLSANMLANGLRVPFTKTEDGYSLALVDGERAGPVVIRVAIGGAPKIERVFAKQSADGNTFLAAKDAEIEGHTAAYEAGKDCIGFWTNPGDAVTWTLDVVRPGRYKVEMTYACEPGSEGSLVAFTASGKELQMSVEKTSGWSDFKTVTLGEVTLEASGLTKFMVKARMKPGLAVMNLRSVRLIPQ